MPRELTDWLSTYIKYTENSEPPKSYHIWCGLSMLAAAVQRKIYMKWGYDNIYSNLYVVLVGPSGRCRKGTAMNMGKDILKDSGIPITSESVTCEALIRAMKNATTNFQDPDTGEIKFHCSLTCMSDELSVFLGQNDIKFIATLTDWYDSKDIWRYETKGAGKDEINGVCFNLLGATAADWFQSILPQEAIGGGFTSRIIFVVEEDKKQTVALPTLTEEEIKMRGALTRDLEKISTLVGQVKFNKDAFAAYDRWYTTEDRNMRAGKFPIADTRFAGYCDRRATHVRKISTLISLSRSDSFIITKADFDRSLSILQAAEMKMHRAFGGLGQAKYSDVTEKVLMFLMSMGVIKRSQLMKRFYRDMDTMTLEIVEKVLLQMKVVKITHNIDENDTTYTYIGPK